MFLHQGKKRHLGFTLIELAIVLGVVGVLAAGLWKLMSTANQQSKDQATAQQQIALINAVKGFLADTSPTGGQTLLTGMAASTSTNIPLPVTNASLLDCQSSTANHGYAANPTFAAMCNYLPPGFTSSTTNPYGQTYSIWVLKDGSTGAPQSYSFMIVTMGGSAIPDTDGGRISSLIGGDGGFIYSSTSICGSFATPTACGSMGGWVAATSTYGYAAGTAGMIASRSFVTTGSDNSEDWLARVPMPGDTNFTYNTMTTDLFMGETNSATPVQTNINMGPSGTTTGTGAIHLYNGYIDGSGTNNVLSQINLTIPASQVTAYIGNLQQLVYLSDGCTQLQGDSADATLVYSATCPPALQAEGDIFSSGEILSTKLYSASDARLKTNIHLLNTPLEHLMQIDAVGFTFKKNGGQSMGVTAQNLEKVYPELVEESNGHKYVEYNGLIGPLIGAVQELKQQNDDLRQQLRQQKLREDKLEQDLKRQKTGP